ncbi:MAG: YibE/F family protein [Ruminiclostridium sp.]
MSVPFVLLFVLLLLMAMIGENRGVKSFFILILNFCFFFILLKFIAAGFDPIKVTVFACIIISLVTLFFINGINKKTVSSFISVIIVVLATILLTYNMTTGAKLQGFSNENPGGAAQLSYYVHIDFSKLVISEILIGLLGAIIDVSISISSSMNEIFKNNMLTTKSNLLKSGINIGRDILGTMSNTLLFAFISGFMTLLMWLNTVSYPINDIINSKIIGAEVFQILCSGIGIILIIPTTAILTTMILFKFPERQNKAS